LEEQLLVVQLHRVKVRVGSAQGTGGLLHHVAFESVGTAVGQNSRRLVWQMFGGVNHFVLNRNFVTNMLTMFDLFGLPNLLCHIGLLL
jgi:hypothetical protein